MIFKRFLTPFGRTAVMGGLRKCVAFSTIYPTARILPNNVRNLKKLVFSTLKINLSLLFDKKVKKLPLLCYKTLKIKMFFTVLPQYITIAKPQPKTILTNFSKLNLWFSVVSKMIVVEICKNIPTTIAKIT